MPRLLIFTVAVFLGLKTTYAMTDPLSECFEKLKIRYTPVVSQLYPDGMPLPTEEEVAEIEREIGSLPLALKRFQIEVSNLGFKGLDPARSNGGANSSLMRLITTHTIQNGWIPFCSAEGSYFSIHSNGAVKFFSTSYGEEAYASLVNWITQAFLTTS